MDRRTPSMRAAMAKMPAERGFSAPHGEGRSTRILFPDPWRELEVRGLLLCENVAISGFQMLALGRGGTCGSGRGSLSAAGSAPPLQSELSLLKRQQESLVPMHEGSNNSFSWAQDDHLSPQTDAAQSNKMSCDKQVKIPGSFHGALAGLRLPTPQRVKAAQRWTQGHSDCYQKRAEAARQQATGPHPPRVAVVAQKLFKQQALLMREN